MNLTSADCVVVGTGLTNSIVAAACSRIGKSVLHVDSNNYYGQEWASFTFQQLIDWVKEIDPNNDCLNNIPTDLLSKSRMFCIDLCPRLLYSNGEMVDLLVKSNVSRYHEFKNNIRILSMIDGNIHVMPCRRSDVFTSPLLSDLVDKRRLMKFLELCIKFDENDRELTESKEVFERSEKPIGEFLKERGLNPVLREYIINSIAMIKPTDTTLQACQNIKRFMIATEKYGRSPFLFPLYGCGEFPQSFCRLSAVFGGVYCLNTQIVNITMPKVDGEQFSVKFSNSEQEVKCDTLVMRRWNSKTNFKMSRAILITRESVSSNSENLISFLRIPLGDYDDKIVYMLELNSSVMVCPPDCNIVYLWCDGIMSDLYKALEKLFKNTSVIIWKFFYQQPPDGAGKQDQIDETTTTTKSLYLTDPPCGDIDYNQSISEAEEIFRKICPGQEFLPRAPDPNEIINDF